MFFNRSSYQITNFCYDNYYNYPFNLIKVSLTIIHLKISKKKQETKKTFFLLIVLKKIK